MNVQSYKIISDFTLEELKSEIENIPNENIIISYTSHLGEQRAWEECNMSDKFRNNMISEDGDIVFHYPGGLKIVFNKIKIKLSLMF